MARYVEILFRFKIRFVILLAILPALVGAVTILLFPSYTASAQLWVDNPSYFGGATPSGWSQYLTPAQNESDSLSQLLSTRAFGREFNRRLADSIPDPAERSRAAAGARVSIYAAGTYMMVVAAACERPSLCIILVNTAIQVLRDQQIDTEKAQARAGMTYITAQLQQTKANLTTSEDALRKYLATHPGAKIEPDPSAIADLELSRLAAEVQQRRSRVIELQDQLSRDNAVVSAPAALFPSAPRVVDPPLVSGGRLGDRTSLRKAAMTGGATLGLGLGYLLLLGWLDKTLRDPRDIEHRFKVPVVTTIPELQPSERF